MSQLIETGKVLRSANKKGVKTIGYTNDRFQALFPNTLEKFHLALDELEYDIVSLLLSFMACWQDPERFRADIDRFEQMLY